MTVTLATGKHPRFPATFARAGQNRILMATGVDDMLRWDGFTASAETAGVTAPTTATTLAIGNPGLCGPGTYTVYVRYLDSEGNPSNLSPISNALTFIGSGREILCTAVPTPTDPNVVRRQILRNTTGQSSTYYIEVNTTDLTTTAFTLSLSDANLSLLSAVALLDTDGNPLANQYGRPPNHKAVVAQHLGRMFAATEVDFNEGHAEVTNGSTTVFIIGTALKDALNGRDFYVVGAPKAYAISAVSTALGTLTLSEAYGGTTDKFAPYAIKSSRTNRRSVHWSQTALPEAWVATNSFQVQESGDEITGLISRGSYLYILEREHTHRLTYQSNPATDAGVFLAAYRGCVNQRCWVVVEASIYMLDEQGIFAFDDGESKPISGQIQDVFRPGTSGYHINWSASKWFHAAWYPAEETIRWFVALEGSYLPKHALCFQYRAERWWIEEFPVYIGASLLTRLGGQPRAACGSRNVGVNILEAGTLDLTANEVGSRGTVTGVTHMSITDAAASFPSDGVDGAPVVIVSGKGKGQLRIVYSHTTTVLNVTTPWKVKPDTTSVYQLGGIKWKWRSGWLKWIDAEEAASRRIGLSFEPTVSAATMDLRRYVDRSRTPKISKVDWDDEGLSIVKDDDEAIVNMQRTVGYTSQSVDDGRERLVGLDKFVSLELAGVTNRDVVRIYQLELDGAG